MQQAHKHLLLCFVYQEKLKEKKPVMTEALTQALQAMHKSGCLTLADAIEGESYLNNYYAAPLYAR